MWEGDFQLSFQGIDGFKIDFFPPGVIKERIRQPVWVGKD